MNVLITGASEGIGYETALRFAAIKDNKVFAIARRADKLRKLASENKEGNIIPVVMDIAGYDAGELIKILKREKVTHIDVLIHNAGYLVNRKFEDLTAEDWEAVYRVNVIGVAMLTRGVINFLGGDAFTHVVMIGSVGGLQGSSKFPGLSAYSSSKGAVSILAEVLAEEFAGRNVFVNCLALGSVQTEMLKKAFPGYTAKTTATEISDFIYEFGRNGWRYFNGKTVPVSTTNP